MPMASLANEGSVFYFRYIFFALGVWYLLDNNKYITKLMLIISIICLIIVCIDGLVQYLSGKDLFGMKTISLIVSQGCSAMNQSWADILP